MKRCRICKTPYTATRPLQPTCDSYDCKVTYALSIAEKIKAKREKADRKETKAKLEKFKTRSEWAADAQKSFNSWIRARDIAAGYGCISCGTKADVQYAAGHFRTVAAAPQLRYSEDNVHLQCNMNCNSAKAGNLLAYRTELVRRIGLDRVEALECDQTVKKYSIQELQEIKEKYKGLYKIIKNTI